MGRAAAGIATGMTNMSTVDATLLACQSEKEQTAPTYKSNLGFHPLGMWLDETREPLTRLLRLGNAGSNTAADHCEVLLRAPRSSPTPLPGGPRRR